MAEAKPPGEALRARSASLALGDQALAGIVNNVVDGIITIDERGIVETVNPAAERLFGYEAREVVGQNVSMLMFEPQRSEHDVYIANYLATGDGKIIGRTGRVLPARHKDGSMFQMDLAVSEFTLEGRRHFVGIVRDLTEHNRVTELAAADKMKDQFLAALAHELRNPLAPIRNAIQVLCLIGPAEPQLEQMRAVIDRQVTHMARLVDDLLNVSRISRGMLELRRERIDLAAVLYHAEEMCRPMADGARHDVSVELPSDPIYLDADPTRLAEVFANLLTNACKYTEPGGRIRLHAEQQGNEAVVTVSDNGIGIPADRMGSIFEMFTQIEDSLDRSQGGLGIGLTLVKRLVEMHEGSVEAHSEGPGKGSEFTVRLPVAVGAVEVPEQPRPAVEATPAVHRILVVDDDRDSAESLALLLKVIGNETQAAFDGEEALEAAETFKPGLVLLDIGLPKLNGYEVCRRIRERWPDDHIVLVALTGRGHDDDLRKSKEAGFDDHMVKPVEFGALMRLLASLPAMHDGRPGGAAAGKARKARRKARSTA